MKNFKLLLATTAILSAGTILAGNSMAIDLYSANTTTTIHAKANLITNLSIKETSVLNFGNILAPRNNQTIKITAAGVRDSNGTNATFADEVFSAGAIVVDGDYFRSGDEYEAAVEAGHMVGNVWESYYLEFPESMQLKSGKTVCGVVSDFDQNSDSNFNDDIGNPLTISYGGTLTLDSQIENLAANQNLECTGEGTVTLIYNYHGSNGGG